MSDDENLPSAAGDAEAKQRGRPFQPGESGNPRGRPAGARNKVTQAVEKLICEKGEALGTKAVDKALEGDSPLLRALLARLVPPRREPIVEFQLPAIESVDDSLAASRAVLTACAAGELSPSEANEIMALISTHVRTVELAQLEVRVNAMEKRLQP